MQPNIIALINNHNEITNDILVAIHKQCYLLNQSNICQKNILKKIKIDIEKKGHKIKTYLLTDNDEKSRYIINNYPDWSCYTYGRLCIFIGS